MLDNFRFNTKQMVDSLHINGRNVSDNFAYALYYIEEDGFEYTAEDIALAKQVCIPMVENSRYTILH